MRLPILVSLAAVAAALAGCAATLPPETAKPVPAPPWIDLEIDSVALDAQCRSGLSPVSCRQLAVRFFQAGDEESGRRTLADGCAGGGSDGCWRWGVAFLRAERVSQDARLARALFESGCESGSLQACRGLFGMLVEPEPMLRRQHAELILPVR